MRAFQCDYCGNFRRAKRIPYRDRYDIPPGWSEFTREWGRAHHFCSEDCFRDWKEEEGLDEREDDE